MNFYFYMENGVPKISQNALIEFSQNALPIVSEELSKVSIKYNGLCEIICNYILLNDMLGSNEAFLADDVNITNLTVEQLVANFSVASSLKKDDVQRINLNPYLSYAMKNQDKFRAHITENKLKTVQETHYLDVIGFISKLFALLFSIYPCNLFSNVPFDKKSYLQVKDFLGNPRVVVNNDVFFEKLSELPPGFYIKMFVFKKVFLSASGHSTLIKKLDDNTYSFFDPDHGEYMGLSFSDLVQKINVVANFGYTHMVFLDAAEFLNSYQLNKNQEGLYNYMPEEMNENAPELINDGIDEMQFNI
jgi:hypothetical protein